MLQQGIYEQIITKLVNSKINELDKDKYFISKKEFDKVEAADLLSRHLSQAIKYALSLITGEIAIEKQIEISNRIIQLLNEELKKTDLLDDLIYEKGEILKAVFAKTDSHFSDLNLRLKEITPLTRLSFSELFTGGNGGLTLESELRKEILSANKIDLLVSFIKFKGIIILEKELREFTNNGGKLRVITTIYMGASDLKAIQLLAELENTEVKVSYNTGNERLHAKAYLFHRNTGFHTGYIGSSNFSRSALTDGLEWNLKVTTKEVGHIIDKFQKTFEAYWQNPEFETFKNRDHSDKLREALNKGKLGQGSPLISFFDIKPFPFQLEILEKLEVERLIHNRFKNLVVAATGTGKTVISAFDYKRFITISRNARLLFIAHRKEILQQARSTFQGVLKLNNFGELWVDGEAPQNFEHVFASIQTLSNRIHEIGFNLSPEYFDFIIIDEVHHIKASSYRPVLNYFNPKILLGLTATPDRMDGADILNDFSNHIAADIRLPEALNRGLLCPFQYFGISDSVDLRNVGWENGKYSISELEKIYTSNDRRVGEIITSLQKYTKDISELRTLGFCVSIEHANYMAEKFALVNLKAGVLTSQNSSERENIRTKLFNREINFLFVVDIFNEGVDIPEVDTVLFLRPTESLTIFLQQLGRGLRLSEGKDCLTVLDFVGNSREEYDFEHKFRALIGKTNSSVQKEIEDDFPHLPLGCSIVLEKVAKENILNNIKIATSTTKNILVSKIRNFENVTSLPLCLRNFLHFYNLPIQSIYKNYSWSKLCQLAGKLEYQNEEFDKEIVSLIKNKWLSTASYNYFNFILKLAKRDFNIDNIDFSENEKTMLLMLHYDFWQNKRTFHSLEDSIKAIGENQIYTNEIITVLELLMDRIDFTEIDIILPYNQPLKVHSRYTRDQILVAFHFSTFETKSSNREGVAENKSISTEILFIDLIKSEEDFSPSTMYNDFAINEYLFHWQSQNSTRNDFGKGLTYISHKKLGKQILLFVREKAKDEFGNTMGYVFLGEGTYVEHYGSKPMSITWELKNPMPNYLWKESAKMNIG